MPSLLGSAAVVGWSPQTFWGVTPVEQSAAVRAYNAAHGGPTKAPPTYEEARQMRRALFEAER